MQEGWKVGPSLLHAMCLCVVALRCLAPDWAGSTPHVCQPSFGPVCEVWRVTAHLDAKGPRVLGALPELNMVIHGVVGVAGEGIEGGHPKGHQPSGLRTRASRRRDCVMWGGRA